MEHGKKRRGHGKYILIIWLLRKLSQGIGVDLGLGSLLRTRPLHSGAGDAGGSRSTFARHGSFARRTCHIAGGTIVFRGLADSEQAFGDRTCRGLVAIVSCEALATYLFSSFAPGNWSNSGWQEVR